MQDASRLSNRQATVIVLVPIQPVSMGDTEWTLVTWSTSSAVWLISVYFPPVGTIPLSGSTESDFRRCFLLFYFYSFVLFFLSLLRIFLAFLFECESVRAVGPEYLSKTITLSAIQRGILSEVRICFPYFISYV